jgi:hypothetical protein
MTTPDQAVWTALTGTGLTLDAGALIAFERADPRVRALLGRAVEQGLPLAVPAAVLAQVWRGRGTPVPRREVVGTSSTRRWWSDTRRREHTVVTSDVDDLRRLDPRLPVIAS